MFPIDRPRRLRHTPLLREMVCETRLHPSDLIMPLFIHEGETQSIPSMPGQMRWSLDEVGEVAKRIREKRIPAVLLFGIPRSKDEKGTESYNQQGVIQRGIARIKEKTPDLCVITDVCLCAYTLHGHCGIVEGDQIQNDPTVAVLTKMAISHAQAGADMVAPSDMMDGRVREIRKGLDEAKLSSIPILSYAVKYASSFYGPFRDAVESAPSFGDRKTHQMDPANRREALREALLDIEEGADMLMVKPALPYLDIISDLRGHTSVPIVAYQVSGEYAMIKAAGKLGWIDEKRVMQESLLSIKRAGADLVITYFAEEVVTYL